MLRGRAVIALLVSVVLVVGLDDGQIFGVWVPIFGANNVR